MYRCRHCDGTLTGIRSARNHHIKCLCVLSAVLPELPCRGLTGSACDACFVLVEPREALITALAPVLPSVHHSEETEVRTFPHHHHLIHSRYPSQHWSVEPVIPKKQQDCFLRHCGSSWSRQKQSLTLHGQSCSSFRTPQRIVAARLQSL